MKVSLKGLGQHEGEYIVELYFLWTILEPYNFLYIILMILTLVDEDPRSWACCPVPTVVMWEIVFSCTWAASNEIQTSLSRINLEHAFDCVAEEMQYHQRASDITKAREKETAR